MHCGDDAAVAHHYTYAPGKILGFLVDRYPSTAPAKQNSPAFQNVQAVVMCCDSHHRKSSVFSTHWKIRYTDKACVKPMISLVSVDAIVRHCLMIPENNELNGFHEIWSRERWGDEFLDLTK